jgi:hypothetical protein
MLKLIVAFHSFAHVPSDENLGSCPCLCGICNKAYFVIEFYVSPSTSFTGILDSVGASERDAA